MQDGLLGTIKTGQYLRQLLCSVLSVYLPNIQFKCFRYACKDLPLSTVTNDDDDFNHAQMQLFCCHPSAATASMLRHKQFLLKIHHNIVHMCTKNIINVSTSTESTKILHTYNSYMPSYLCLLLRYRYKPYLALLRYNTKIFNHPTSGKLKCNVSNSGIIGWPQLQIM